MYKGYIRYRREDAAYDEVEKLDSFGDWNLLPEHDSDIGKVRYRKQGNTVFFESDDLGALRYVMDFASEDEDFVLQKKITK